MDTNNLTTTQAHLNNIQTFNNAKKPDRSYISEWGRFKKFIQSKRAEGSNQVDGGLHFITHTNVDHYFSTDVAQRKISGDSARRAVSALQYFANHYEYAGIDVQFQVDSRKVKDAIEAVRVNFNRAASEKSCQDLHENLRDNKISAQEMRRAMANCLKQCEWKDLAVTIATCKSTYIRNASMRILSLSRYRVKAGYHPSGSQYQYPFEDSSLFQLVI